jgi:signal recognition particle GTPase
VHHSGLKNALRKPQKKIAKNEFIFDDFSLQIQQVKKMVNNEHSVG